MTVSARAMSANQGVLFPAALFMAALLLLPTAGWPQVYPHKPVRLIVPAAPGGGTDIIARLLGEKLSAAFGQPVVVDNRSGAGTVLGTDIAAKAPPDGYTLLLQTLAIAFSPALNKKLPYDALRDLAPVTLVAAQPNILVVHPSVPARSLKELVELARVKPGTLAFASAGVGSGTHLAGELLRMSLKIDILHVPYKGTGPAMTDLIGGQVQMLVSTFASVLPHIKSGRLRALGVTTTKRSLALPDVPTLVEQGAAGLDYATWYGMLVPARTPGVIIDKLNKTTRDALATDEMKQKFDAQGVEPLSNTPAEFAAYLKSETEKWTRVVRAAKIAPQ